MKYSIPKLEQIFYEDQQGINTLENFNYISEILKEGWPKNLTFTAYLGIFLTLQHSIFIEDYLQLFREAVKSGDAYIEELVLMEDRCLVMNNKKQLYGTQFDLNNNMYFPTEEGVEERRALLNLDPL